MVTRILIIEDDPAIRLGLTESLGDLAEIQTARDGEQGLRAARCESIDLIVLDLMLPALGGREICRELRSSGIFTPIPKVDFGFGRCVLLSIQPQPMVQLGRCYSRWAAIPIARRICTR